jgi:hypothetical protein
VHQYYRIVHVDPGRWKDPMLCHRKAVRLKKRRKRRKRTAEEREEETGMTSPAVVGVFLGSVDRMCCSWRLVAVEKKPWDHPTVSFSLVGS